MFIYMAKMSRYILLVSYQVKKKASNIEFSFCF